MPRRNTFPRQGLGQGGQAAALSSLRVTDSCADRACMEDLPVTFSAQDQVIIDESVMVKQARAVVERVDFDIQPAQIRRGCWLVECTIHLAVSLDAYATADAPPTPLRGTACCRKSTVLFGGERMVRVFRSDGSATTHAPEASIQIADPVVLAACLRDCCQDDQPRKTVLLTLGLFTVISLERPAQLVLPVLDHAIPERTCPSLEEDPCARFDNMRFPTNRFFPGAR